MPEYAATYRAVGDNVFISPHAPEPRISDDGSAIIGKNGHIFVYKGSNNVLSIYQDNDHRANSEIAQRWVLLARERLRRSHALGARFIQMMIPEKSSVLPMMSPIGNSGASPLWTWVLEALNANVDSTFEHINGFKILQACDCPTATYLTMDSHFSSYGAETIMRDLLPQSARARYRRGKTRTAYAPGDLGKKFPVELRPFDREAIAVLDGLSISTEPQEPPQLVEEVNPPSGHRGTMRRWRNSNPVSDEVALCFGNSFFERGLSSTSLSWWGARFFREFYFCWSPDIDWELAGIVRPTIIIGQSIERFLRVLPGS